MSVVNMDITLEFNKLGILFLAILIYLQHNKKIILFKLKNITTASLLKSSFTSRRK